MSALTATLRGQALAEALMVDACTVQHQTGDPAADANGVVTTPYGTAFYTGPCQVQTKKEYGQDADVGQAYRIVTRRIVKLPMAVTGVVAGDRITITAAALDAALVGNVYIARDVEEKTFLTARRVTCLDVSS